MKTLKLEQNTMILEESVEGSSESKKKVIFTVPEGLEDKDKEFITGCLTDICSLYQGQKDVTRLVAALQKVNGISNNFDDMKIFFNSMHWQIPSTCITASSLCVKFFNILDEMLPKYSGENAREMSAKTAHYYVKFLDELFNQISSPNVSIKKPIGDFDKAVPLLGRMSDARTGNLKGFNIGRPRKIKNSNKIHWWNPFLWPWKKWGQWWREKFNAVTSLFVSHQQQERPIGCDISPRDSRDSSVLVLTKIPQKELLSQLQGNLKKFFFPERAQEMTSRLENIILPQVTNRNALDAFLKNAKTHGGTGISYKQTYFDDFFRQHGSGQDAAQQALLLFCINYVLDNKSVDLQSFFSQQDLALWISEVKKKGSSLEL